jgi:Uma2 family endonuclease
MSRALSPASAGPPADDSASLYEVVDGRRVESPMGIKAAWIATLLVEYLAPFVRANGLGRIVSEGLFDLIPQKPQRRPDVSFVSFARWPRDRGIPESDNAWAVVPDLAIEVVSPTNTAQEVLDKLDEYFAAGVRRVWVVYPSKRLVYVYASPKSNLILGLGDALDGEDVLPGLRLPVADLFEDVAGAE